MGERKDEMGISAGAERRDLSQQEITWEPTFGESIFGYMFGYYGLYPLAILGMSSAWPPLFQMSSGRLPAH